MDNSSSISEVTRPAARSAGSQTQSPALGSKGLPVGARLREFEIVSLIGEGGFGVVYLANDHVLGRQVALKEFLPASISERTPDLTVSARAGQAELFQLGLRSFMNEARLLAQFDHPSLVRVYQYWEGNGTAYMVMPFYRGITLRTSLKNRRGASDLGPPDERWLRNLLMPLLEALETIHAVQCYHRDIAPDNIILLEGSGRPLLLDFGSARLVIGDVTHALTAFVKPGFAPIEQYAQDDSMRQGPWTDIYALAATLYFAITGELPVVSTTRAVSDDMPPLAKRMKGRYSPGFLQAIDRGLAVRPEQRVQTVGTWRTLLESPLEITEAPLEVVRSGPHALADLASPPGEASLARRGPPPRASVPPESEPAPAANPAGRSTAGGPADPPASSDPGARSAGTDPAGRSASTGPTARSPSTDPASRVPSSQPAAPSLGNDPAGGSATGDLADFSAIVTQPAAEVVNRANVRAADVAVTPSTPSTESPSPTPRRATARLVQALVALAAILVGIAVWYAVHEQRHPAAGHASPATLDPMQPQTPGMSTQTPGTSPGSTDPSAPGASVSSVTPRPEAVDSTVSQPGAQISEPTPQPVLSCDVILHRATAGERVTEEELRYLEEHCSD